MRLYLAPCALLMLCTPLAHAANAQQPQARYQPSATNSDAAPEDTSREDARHENTVPQQGSPQGAMHEQPQNDADNVQDPDAENPGDMPEAETPVIAPVTAPTPPPPTVDAGAPKPPSDSGDTNYNTVQLQALNKVTARAESIDAPIGSVTRYGTIEIIAHKCWKSSPEDRPENAALLEVSEIKQGEAPQRIFSGWMFSSTPALSALEHPFYDINVISCSKTAAK